MDDTCMKLVTVEWLNIEMVNVFTPLGLYAVDYAVASGDVTKASDVTEAVAAELECMRKDAASINGYCQECDNKSEPYSAGFLSRCLFD